MFAQLFSLGPPKLLTVRMFVVTQGMTSLLQYVRTIKFVCCVGRCFVEINLKKQECLSTFYLLTDYIYA